ncbi:hypothetical protein AB0I60_26615 [Actinosynnema sp. NPDC050436]|uniref:hypothetical protein n=1 Tax=Actinosynnema sp. NPDC050436 TaxID=3155659 RepID=UPI0033D6CC5B
MTLPEQATRTAVGEVWQAVVDGTLSRVEAHRWAARWIEADDAEALDRLVLSALQRLHGFDLVWTDGARTTVRHGGSEAYVHSAGEIRQALTAWQDDCRSYDADPVEYVQREKAEARAAARSEH